MEYYSRRGLSSFWIKIIAIISMTVDHSAQIVFNLTESTKAYQACKLIGRLSLPLFCFILVEGLFHTRNRLKHAILLLVFAIVSNPFYNFFGAVMGKKFVLFKFGFINFREFNILFTLLIGYLIIWAYDYLKHKNSNEDDVPSMGQNIVNIIILIIMTAAGCFVAQYFNCMYGYAGVLMIVGFYLSRNSLLGQFFTIAICSFLYSNILITNGNIMYNIHPHIQWFAVLALIPIFFYNRQPGRFRWKYFFYVYYPIHLLVLGLLKLYTK